MRCLYTRHLFFCPETAVIEKTSEHNAQRFSYEVRGKRIKRELLSLDDY